ncbi:MAG: type I restriction endonuclease subunit R [Paludibacteraceae bacterium]|nr:type I restriction endonuclease subunit R [Paludibacteraceae bacterium]
MGLFDENAYEQALIQLFQGLGYDYVYGPDLTDRDYTNPLLDDVVLSSLSRINRLLPDNAIAEALRKLKHIEGANLSERNFKFTQLMQNGVEVSYSNVRHETKHDLVKLIDFENPGNNSFLIVNQFSVRGFDLKRADMVVFVNGFPLVVVELKSPSREETDASEAYLQLRNYMGCIPDLFTFNAFCVMSDMAETKIGTITAKEDRYMVWKQPDGKVADYDTIFKNVFQPKVFLNLLKNYILWDENGIDSKKILAGYHQFYAVEKAAVRAEQAVKGNGKIGVFWHTQGSGKSLSMVMFAHHPVVQQMNATLVVITDRNDLDDQLYGQFRRTTTFLRQTAVQATDRKHLRELLANRVTGGIIFTTMQKFEDYDSPLSERKNIIVMTDEAHRGQYGMEEKIGEDGRVHIGTARKIRNSLPNASFVGFTGTPISDKDRDTQEVFGDYIDVYDMTQAVEDGATMPVYYESRVIKLKLNEDVLRQIDDEYDRLRDEGADEADIEQNKKEMSHMDALLGTDETINSLVDDILDHYEHNRQQVCGGKAMIVAYSRPIAMKIYKRILELRSSWNRKVKVVMTSGNQDPEEWQQVIGSKGYKKDLAARFKDVNSELKIVIVVDMWLTGFDVPSLATMYVFKPMKGHNLMQAIARVNRVFAEKSGGLIVDYVGIAAALRKAMNVYTKRDRDRFADNNIRTTAYEKFQEHMQICKDMLHGFDFSQFQKTDDAGRANLIKGGVNFLMAPSKSDEQESFLKHAALLNSSVTLCRSLLNDEQRYESAFMESVRTIITRLLKPGKVSKKQINERISALLQQSVESEGVVNIFDQKTEFSLFDEKFMEEVRNMKEKNIAAQLLAKLLRGKVNAVSTLNLVQGEAFSKMLENTLSRYLKGLLDNEDVIKELLAMAKEFAKAEEAGKELGLSPEEKAFYDALTKPQAVRDFYENDELVKMTKELTEMLRKNNTIDWYRRESERANMRRLVKRLLKKYKYPPEKQEDAMNDVLRQCEQWVEENQSYESREYMVDELGVDLMAADHDFS